MLYYVLQPHGCTYHMYYLLILGRVYYSYDYTYIGTLQYVLCVRVSLYIQSTVGLHILHINYYMYCM